jgi:transcriptional regulator NrdR family protein
MQLKVIKRDGQMEEYLHTKVIGTFSNALGLVDDANIFAAEQFAEAVTFYLYEKHNSATVTSEEIHLMMQSVLLATGYEHAAEAINEYRLNRKLMRSRIEVVDDKPEDAAGCFSFQVDRWDKSRIVENLIGRDHVEPQTARAIASAVEQKVLNLGMTRIRRRLIGQLVIADKDAMLEAQSQLMAVS